jgi:hypothetical protein
MGNRITVAAMLFLFFTCKLLYGEIAIDIETGVVKSSYNDIRIPGDTGSSFSLTDELEESPECFYRLRGSYQTGSHTLSFLYAPLSVESKGTLTRDIVFHDRTFQAGREIEARFVFNSYRLTYRYAFVRNEELYFGAGLTGKVRDAEISLDNGIEKAEKKNVGFVPLINFSCRWKFYGPFGILIDGDALFATQGRAEDISLALLYHLNRNLTFRGGYRILEGGADNDEVYTFSMFHYALVGIRFQF